MSYICEDCPRLCKIDRKDQIGFCGGKDKILVAKVIKNFMWEEPSICFDKGVTAIFFSSCNLKCEFCQNKKISREACGKEYTVEGFVKLLKKLDEETTDGIDLISPTHFSTLLLKVFAQYKPKNKVIWNSNGYERKEIVEKLSTYVDVFLPDFKYFSNELAFRLSKCLCYRENCEKAIEVMVEKKPNIFNGKEMVQGVIIRHLILPDEVDDSCKVLEEIRRLFPDVYLSLMCQFTPTGEGEKKRKITPLEYKIVLSKFKKLGLKNGYMQDFDSSSDDFVPNF